MAEDQKFPNKIKIHYKKLEGYRSYYADGFIGGLTPHGDVYFEPFIERNPTPLSIFNEVEPDGKFGKELRNLRETKDGMIRQIECGLSLKIETAIALRNWLDDKIKQFNEKSPVKKIMEDK